MYSVCLCNEEDFHPVLTGNHSASAYTLALAKDLPLHKQKHFFLTVQSKRSFFTTENNPTLLAYRTSINPTFYQTKVEICLFLFFMEKTLKYS